MRHAKTTVPPLPSQLVERDAVRALLADGAPDERGRVVLVGAPLGYGKTVAVADWVRATPELPTAWLSLDAGDRDHTAWWRSVLGALATCDGVPEDSALREIPAGTDGTDALAAAVLEGLDGLPGPVRLVLDDVHEIVGHPAERGLHALVRHPLPGVVVVLVGRCDAPVGVDRLRLHGRLTELRADRLRFDVQEAGRLFAAAAVDLDPDQVRTLVDRTEGWVAALWLVALSLRSAPDPAGVVASFAGDDRAVDDYLAHEVVGALAEDERRALEAASACGPVAVDLAAALTGDPRAGDVLARLASMTALVTATDRHRERFRVHELLCSHLLARLRREHPDRLRGMYHRAATWHEAADDTPAAIHFAALAGDVVGTEALLRDDAVELLASGRSASLRDAGRLVEARGGDTEARLVLALAALEDGDTAHAASLVAALGPERAGRTDVLARIVDVRLALAGGDRAGARDLAAGLRPETADAGPVHALALVTRGLALTGADPDQARRDAAAALAGAPDHARPLLEGQTRTVLALTGVVGHPREADGHAAAALALAARHDGDRAPWAAGARLVRAVAHLLAGRPDEALAEVARAVAPGPWADALAVVRRAAEHDAGDTVHAGPWRSEHHGPLRDDGGPGDRAAVALAALLDQDLALARGRVRDAAEVTHAAGRRLEGTGDLAVLRARDARTAGDDAAARACVAPVLDRGDLGTLTALAVVQAWVLEAEVALARRQMPLARARVLGALDAAAERGVLRPLLRAGPAVHHYLAARQGMFGEHEGLVGRVLSSMRVPSDTALVALTDREQEVLSLLPTTRSAAEIAEDLAVSTNTVKTHQRAIYHKLGAGGRRDAVTRARRAGLLTHSA